MKRRTKNTRIDLKDPCTKGCLSQSKPEHKVRTLRLKTSQGLHRFFKPRSPYVGHSTSCLAVNLEIRAKGRNRIYGEDEKMLAASNRDLRTR